MTRIGRSARVRAAGCPAISGHDKRRRGQPTGGTPPPAVSRALSSDDEYAGDDCRSAVLAARLGGTRVVSYSRWMLRIVPPRTLVVVDRLAQAEPLIVQ